MADEATRIGYAMLPVTLSFDGITKDIADKMGVPLKAAATSAGRDAGEAIAAGVEQAKGKVEAATAKIAAANKKVEDQTGKLRVAEAQLQALRERGVTDAGKLAAAEEKVAAAQRNVETASRASVNATGALENAQRGLEEASRRAAEAQSGAARAGDEAGRSGGTLQRINDKLGASFDGLGGKAKEFAKTMGPAMLVAAPAALAGIGAALMNIGGTFDDVTDTIRVGTGASGAALDGLVASAKKVGSEVPAEFGEISTTVADLNTRLGLTGEPLETLTKQFVELGRITGSEVDINGVSAAFQAFGVQGAQTSGAMDELFRVSQATGVGVNELAAAAVKGAPQLKQFGFSLSSSAAIVGQLDKVGIDSQATLGAMGKAMVNLAKDGKSGQQALYEVVSGVEDLIAKGDEAGAINSAGKVFGTKGAAQFVEAIRAGTLSVDDFMSAAGASQDTILGLGEETADFAEQWQLFKNKVLLTIEPIASKLFSLIGEGFSWFADRAVPAMETFSAVAAEAWKSDGVQSFISSITSVFETVWPKLVSGFDTAKSIAGELAPIVSTVLVGAFNILGTAVSTVVDVGAGIVKFFTENKEMAAALGVVLAVTLGPALVSMAASALSTALAVGIWNAAILASTVASKAAALASKAWAAGQWILNAALSANPIGLIVIAITALVAGLVYAWKHSEKFRDIVTGAWNWIKDAIGAVVSWVTDSVVPWLGKAWETISNGVKVAVDWIKQNWDLLLGILTGPIGLAVVFITRNWDAIKNAIAAVVTWIKNTVVGLLQGAWDGIKAGLDLLVSGAAAAWDLFTAPARAMAEWFTGTLLPWFSKTWEDVKAGFRVIVTVAQEIWDGVKQKFTGIVDYLASLPGAIADKARGMWDGISSGFKTMINFLIDGWNKFAGMLSFTVPDITGVPRRGEKIQPIPTISWRMEDGGVLPQQAVIAAGRGKGLIQWAEGRTGGEAFIPMGLDKRARSTMILSDVARRFGKTLVDSNNPFRSFENGGITDGERARMGGGTVNLSLLQAIRSKFPNAKLNSAKTDHDDDGLDHPKGLALDIEPSSAIAAWLFENRKALGLKSIIFGQDGGQYQYYNAGGVEASGKDVQAQGIYDAGLMAQHMDHIHVAASKVIDAAALGVAPTSAQPDSAQATTTTSSESTSSGTGTSGDSKGMTLGQWIGRAIFGDWKPGGTKTTAGASVASSSGASTTTSTASSVAASTATTGKPTVSAATSKLGSLTAKSSKEDIAAAIYLEGRRRGLTDAEAKAVVATSLQEAPNLNPLADGGDQGIGGALGLFQQGNSYGAREDRLDPNKAISAFYGRLGETQGDIWDRITAVQQHGGGAYQGTSGDQKYMGEIKGQTDAATKLIDALNLNADATIAAAQTTKPSTATPSTTTATSTTGTGTESQELDTSPLKDFTKILGSGFMETLGLDGSLFPDIANLGIVKMAKAVMGIKFTPPPWMEGKEAPPPWLAGAAAPFAPASAAASAPKSATPSQTPGGGLDLSGVPAPGAVGPGAAIPIDASLTINNPQGTPDALFRRYRRVQPEQRTRLAGAIPVGR